LGPRGGDRRDCARVLGKPASGDRIGLTNFGIAGVVMDRTMVSGGGGGHNNVMLVTTLMGRRCVLAYLRGVHPCIDA
jgi:hypothetical protein